MGQGHVRKGREEESNGHSTSGYLGLRKLAATCTWNCQPPDPSSLPTATAPMERGFA